VQDEEEGQEGRQLKRTHREMDQQFWTNPKSKLPTYFQTPNRAQGTKAHNQS
jgi:hypothetical protein